MPSVSCLWPNYHVLLWLVCVQDNIDTYEVSRTSDTAHDTSMSEVLLMLAAMRAEMAAIREENRELRSMILCRLPKDEQ